jgi:prephenate dehydratase
MAFPRDSAGTRPARIAFFGPAGTFTEQALRTQADLATAELVAYRTVPDVLDAVSLGHVEAGFVPIENSIEGMVNFTVDAIAFDHSLVITREVVLDIELCLVAAPGTLLAEVSTVLSIPIAIAQCHRFLRQHMPAADVRATNSTAEAARTVSESPGLAQAAIAPRLAAQLYGLDVLAAGVEDHPGNQTRFVLVERDGIPSPTGSDRTALVVYQDSDKPGSLISILKEFADRRVNLSNLISRPTKQAGLGYYCFIIFVEGHVADEALADALVALHATQGAVKFLGSYPSAVGDDAREHSARRWNDACEWLSSLRSGITPA